MQIHWRVCLLVLPGLALHSAEVCNPATFAGPYAFQLTGTTDISGTPQPTASLGRLVFDGHGGVTGTASATFRGLLLGNPVTGTYEAKSDCSFVWKLQDDSGAFQNFAGTLSADGATVQFRQTDPGGAQRGIMKKTPDTCSTADLLTQYAFSVSGSTTPMNPGETGHTVNARGTLEIARNGSFQVERDCSVRFTLALESSTISLRGFLVNGGKEILAFQTDPGAMVAARLTPDGNQPSNSR